MEIIHPVNDPFYRKGFAEAVNDDCLWLYRSRFLHSELKRFGNNGYRVAGMDDSRQLVKPGTLEYAPNPFMFQYDLEIECFLRFDEILREELRILEGIKNKNEGLGRDVSGVEREIQRVRTVGATGLTREEHLWNAISIRYPEKIGKGGAIQGLVIRHEWIEEVFTAIANYSCVITMGGSGQGKTHGFIAFICLMWDHFIDTMAGARCCFSTVAKDKLNSAAWPWLQKIYHGTKPGISLYAGRGRISGEHTVRRPVNLKDLNGVIKGLLVSDQGAKSTDKLTGGHNRNLGIYLIDEMQSTEEAPVEASPNFLQHPRYGWIFASGNPDKETDQLGINAKPIDGWASVNQHTLAWDSRMITGRVARVLHFNNDYSPGMSKKGGVRYADILPTKSKKKESYPDAESRKTDKYRRFWEGWFPTESITDFVITRQLVTESGADKKPRIPVGEYHKFISIDTANYDIDKSVVVRCCIQKEEPNGKYLLVFKKGIEIEKSPNPNQSIHHITYRAIEIAGEFGAKSGSAIIDETAGAPAYRQKALEFGFDIKPMHYNKAVPDKPKGPSEKRRILIDNVTNSYAHEKCDNLISLGAYMIQQYMLHGQVRGLDNNFCPNFDEQILKREFKNVLRANYGERFRLEDKREFKKKWGFSPDYLDCIFQAGFYALVYCGLLPGSGYISYSNVIVGAPPNFSTSQSLNSAKEQYGYNPDLDALEHSFSLEDEDAIDQNSFLDYV